MATTQGTQGMQRRVRAGDGVELAVRVYEPADQVAEAGHAPEPTGGRPGSPAEPVPTLVCVHGYPDNSSLWDASSPNWRAASGS
nr:hypothetical protein [Saccharomonospora sp. CUA-673]